MKKKRKCILIMVLVITIATEVAIVGQLFVRTQKVKKLDEDMRDYMMLNHDSYEKDEFQDLYNRYDNLSNAQKKHIKNYDAIKEYESKLKLSIFVHNIDLARDLVRKSLDVYIDGAPSELKGSYYFDAIKKSQSSQAATESLQYLNEISILINAEYKLLGDDDKLEEMKYIKSMKEDFDALVKMVNNPFEYFVNLNVPVHVLAEISPDIVEAVLVNSDKSYEEDKSAVGVLLPQIKNYDGYGLITEQEIPQI